eukprot:761154-Hanusia_phi.AAC.2
MALLAHERNLLKPDDKFLQEAKTVFVKYDEDKDGFLNLHEVRNWGSSICLVTSPHGTSSYGCSVRGRCKKSRREPVQSCAHNFLTKVGWDIFYDAMLRRKIDVRASAVDEVRQAFKAFDRRSAGAMKSASSRFDADIMIGFLTLADVKNAFREVAPHVSERIIEEIFFEFDEDRDGSERACCISFCLTSCVRAQLHAIRANVAARSPSMTASHGLQVAATPLRYNDGALRCWAFLS